MNLLFRLIESLFELDEEPVLTYDEYFKQVIALALPGDYWINIGNHLNTEFVKAYVLSKWLDDWSVEFTAQHLLKLRDGLTRS